MLKQFCGQKIIRGRQIYHEGRNFIPTAKLVCIGNHKIEISPDLDDSSLMRRSLYIPFYNPIPEEEQDPDLLRKLIAERGYLIKNALEALSDLCEKNFVFTSLTIADDFCCKSKVKNRFKRHISNTS